MFLDCVDNVHDKNANYSRCRLQIVLRWYGIELYDMVYLSGGEGSVENQTILM